MTSRLARTLAALALIAPICFIDVPPAYAQSARSTATTTAHVAIPESPAGHVLDAWLEAFNSGDSARLEAYYRRYQPDQTAAGQMRFRNQTGGFDLLGIEKRAPSHIEFLIKERNSATRALGVLDVATNAPDSVTFFTLRAMPVSARVADFMIDSATRASVIDSAIAALNEYYVFPNVAQQMAQAVRAREARGKYDSMTNGLIFAHRLMEDFRAVSHDKHLRVDFTPTRLPDGPRRETPEDSARFREQMQRVHCGFAPTKRFPGDIGYLKFDFFANPDICGSTVQSAMQSLDGVRALIIDVRENTGGSPAMVTLVCSYLFPTRTHLNDLWNRETNKTTEYWTHPDVRPQFAHIPIYVLTSRHTFSGGEEFTYDLQTQKRAMIVGEVTGGGAHPVAGHRIGPHFTIGVPGGRAINPITKTSWEGVGVQPDVKVSAADALATAEKLAAERMGTRSSPRHH